jgi:Fe/S biogenesis protein NfuA
MTTETTQAEQGQETPILTFTDAARTRVKEFLEKQGRPGLALRVAVAGRTAGGFRYQLGIVEEATREPDDVSIDAGDFRVLIDPESLEDMRGSELDYVETAGGGGLQINNPNPAWRDPIAQRVQEVLDERINPGVAQHGGFIELLGVKGDKAYIRMGGGCVGCGMADVTLKQGVETAIVAAVPEITGVIDETDHASGENPYYRPAKGAA